MQNGLLRLQPDGSNSGRPVYLHRVLIVDDDPMTRRALVEILSGGGYECDQAESVEEALLYLRTQIYTCVLTDLIMPERSGLDLLQEVKNHYPDIAVILISGHNDTVMVRKALKSGAYDYVVKPATTGEILSTINAALRKRDTYLREQNDRESLREKIEIGMVESILFEDIVRSTIDGIMITDLSNRIIMVNPAYETLTGFQRPELIGTIPSIFSATGTFRDLSHRVNQALTNRGSWSGELIDHRKDKTQWYAHLTITRVKDSRGHAFADVFIVRDITDKKYLEQQLLERLQEVQSAQDAAIIGFAKLAECRNPETGIHLERMRTYCKILAEELSRLPEYQAEIDENFIDSIYKSSPLHDIGKVGIPDSILLKPGKLTPEEYEIMKTHTLIGGDALKTAENKLPGRSFLSWGREIAYNHHEKFDGSGYPFGLRGKAIPLSARIVAFADAYDALTSKRVYKDEVSPEESKRRLIKDRGTHFDPGIADAFLRIEGKFLAVLELSSGEDPPPKDD
jgi:PAS domain S-box-containing protein